MLLRPLHSPLQAADLVFDVLQGILLRVLVIELTHHNVVGISSTLDGCVDVLTHLGCEEG